VTLDLNPTSGLFTWASLRESPEGGVYCWCFKPESAQLIQAQAAPLPWSHQPMIATGSLEELVTQTRTRALSFDRVIAQGLLSDGVALPPLLDTLASTLTAGGRALLLEPSLSPTSLLEALLKASPELEEALKGEEGLLSAWRASERALLEAQSHPLANPQQREEMEALLHAYGLMLEAQERYTHTKHQRLTPGLLQALTERHPQRTPLGASYLSQLCAFGLSEDHSSRLSALIKARVGLSFQPHITWSLLLVRPLEAEPE